MENDSGVHRRKNFYFTKNLVFHGTANLYDCNKKSLNGNGIRMAIIDIQGNINAIKLSQDPQRIQIKTVTSQKSSPVSGYEEHAFHSAVVAAGDSCKTETVTYPGGIANGANVDVFLVHNEDRATVREALKQIVEGDYDVLSISMGSPYFTDPVWDKKINELKNTIVVAAAGNHGNLTKISPSTKISYFTPTNADVYCYGEVSVLNSDGTIARNARGTSLAAPAVAGLVCIILQIIKGKIEFTPSLIRAIQQKMFNYSPIGGISNDAVSILRSLANDPKIFLKDHYLNSRKFPSDLRT